MTAAELSTAALRQQILSREILPGSRVTEDAVASELGVSRATVRQALNSLELEGLLVRNPTSRVLEVLSLDADDVKDIYQARRVLELAGVEASADAPEEALEELKQAVTQMKEAAENTDFVGFVEADARSHAVTVGFLNSRVLSETHASLMRRIRLAITHLEEDENVLAEELLQHEQFCDLVLAGKVEEAKQNLATRLDVSEQAMLQSLVSAQRHRSTASGQ
jgi:DNA-binding GntR family transcriptional regulator